MLISPVFGAPLLLIEGKKRILVASDLHLGLEYELWQSGISIPSQTEKILQRLQNHLARIAPDRLLLLGDVKHNVPRTSWQEKREVPEFLHRLSEEVPVEIVPGNHDGGLADMAPPGVRVRASSGIVLDGVGYFHGHTWPDVGVLQADLLVCAHLHPAIRLKDPLGCSFTRRVWARGPRACEGAHDQEAHGRVGKVLGAPPPSEIIIMPAFNDLCGGLALNEPCDEKRGPILSLPDMDRLRIYLLDGTDLGLLGEIKAALERQGGE